MTNGEVKFAPTAWGFKCVLKCNVCSKSLGISFQDMLRYHTELNKRVRFR